MKRLVTLVWLSLALFGAGLLGPSGAAADPGDFCVVEGRMELDQPWIGGSLLPRIEYYSTTCVIAGAQRTPSSTSLTVDTQSLVCDTFEMFGNFSAADVGLDVAVRFQTSLAGGQGVLVRRPDSSTYTGWTGSWTYVAEGRSEPIGTIHMTPLHDQQDVEQEVNDILAGLFMPAPDVHTNVGCNSNSTWDTKKTRYFYMVFVV